jgi:DNA-binding beta-propeller fold protein YncE
MTSQSLSLGPAAELPETPVVPEEDERRRRRRLLILFFLGLLLLLFIAFSTWYLIFRKPITEIVPPVDTFAMPTYQWSAYDLTKPLGVAVTSDGSRIYVTQGDGTQETVILDGSGHRIGTLTPPPSVITRATQMYVAVDPTNGDVYTTDRAAGLVFVYGGDGRFKHVLQSDPVINGFQPLAIFVDRDGHVFVTDVGSLSQTVHEFDRDGRLLRDFGGVNEFSFPNSVAVDAKGNVYVTDSNNGRLVVFDADGKQIGVITRGPGKGNFGLPRGTVVDDQGRLYVVDAVGQGVQVFKAIAEGEQAPRFVDHFGTEGISDGAFEFPNGIAVDGRSRLYVADWNNDRIQIWSY